MAGIDNEGQWIVTIAFIISVGIFFLGILINQSVLVGQTTAEAVNEFPKTDIQDLRYEVRTINARYSFGDNMNETLDDLSVIGLERKTEVIDISPPEMTGTFWNIHFNNGVTSYDETIRYWDF